MDKMGGDRIFDVLCVGDVVTDAFIKLEDDQATTFDNEHGRWLAMPFGMKLPFNHAEVIEGVGNAANAAVAFAKLGLKTGHVTDVGSDQQGRDIVSALSKRKVDTRFVKVHGGRKSNYHFVLWYKEERTILIKHEDYDYNWPRIKQSDIPSWIYFSSISSRALDMHEDIAEWLERHPEVKMAFQPGTFQISAGTERLANLYKHTEVLLLNREEAVQLTGGSREDVNDLITRLHALGPKIVVVTDGPKGAYASNGTERYKMPPYPDPAPPFERTGAGDAFSSTFVAQLVKGGNIESALQLAPINSMSVVQKTGAQAGLLKESELEDYLKKAPEWYKAEKF